MFCAEDSRDIAAINARSAEVPSPVQHLTCRRPDSYATAKKPYNQTWLRDPALVERTARRSVYADRSRSARDADGDGWRPLAAMVSGQLRFPVCYVVVIDPNCADLEAHVFRVDWAVSSPCQQRLEQSRSEHRKKQRGSEGDR